MKAEAVIRGCGRLVCDEMAHVLLTELEWIDAVKPINGGVQAGASKRGNQEAAVGAAPTDHSEDE